MFLGTHSPRLDEKGRIILPAKFREELASGLVLTRGQERCIYVFSEKEFARVHEQMRAAPIASKQARDYIRVFLSGASDEVPDKQGRVTIPPALRSTQASAGNWPLSAPGPAPRSGMPRPGMSTSQRRKRHSLKLTTPFRAFSEYRGREHRTAS